MACTMTRAPRAGSRSLRWGSAVPAVRLPNADAQTEPAFVSVPHLVLQCGAPPATGYISFQFKIVLRSLILVGEECMQAS